MIKYVNNANSAKIVIIQMEFSHSLSLQLTLLRNVVELRR